MKAFSELNLNKIVALHRPLFCFGKGNQDHCFLLTMPLTGKEGDVEYVCYYGSEYLLFERRRLSSKAVYDKQVYFLAKRSEYTFSTEEEYFIVETVFQRAPIAITFELNSHVNVIGRLYEILGLPHFPFAPFAYYDELFVENKDIDACTLCSKRAPFYMNVMMEKVSDPEKERKLFHICPRCVHEGRVHNINNYESDPEEKASLIFDNTPYVITGTHVTMDAYRAYDPDAGYYVRDEWPTWSESRPYDAAPVFIGLLRMDEASDMKPIQAFTEPDDRFYIDVPFETREILELDCLDEATEETIADYVDAINAADIRIFAHFGLENIAGQLVPKLSRDCKGYTFDVTCRGYVD